MKEVTNDVNITVNEMEEYRRHNREWPDVRVPTERFTDWVNILQRDLPLGDPQAKGTVPNNPLYDSLFVRFEQLETMLNQMPNNPSFPIGDALKLVQMIRKDVL